MIDHMKALQLMNNRQVLENGLIIEVAVWSVPEKVLGSDHYFKYRLQCCYPEKTLVRYDNERGKGDHKHLLNQDDIPVDFVSIEQLMNDFAKDVFEVIGVKL